ncbi:HEPN domain-containing protein [Pseudomonas stutzeri]|uniref:HEPN domain-containing protein n=1 Tax=Stutzerimonas stutzeri TaxID=316 RepID=UPI00210AD975|nr:HEPN domain-containing protein [Stutzerimonas stutzeri]MCQ4286368.1 HEPN domain-containing protein [Stutzerimonas stutzeri]
MDTVQVLYGQVKEIDEFLMGSGEISLKSAADSNFRKSVLLASASFFETEITNIIVSLAQEVTKNDHRIVSFVQKKGLARQYHSLFNWDSKNCNAFLGLFGEDFKTEFCKLITMDDALDKAIKAFIEIGAERNRLVHQNFGQYTIEKTSEEIYELHLLAKYFVLMLRAGLAMKPDPNADDAVN